MKDGIPSLIITYLIVVVYQLYLEMLQGPLLPTLNPHGVDNVVFVTEGSSSVLGRSSNSSDQPPSYDSLVETHKQHVRT